MTVGGGRRVAARRLASSSKGTSAALEDNFAAPSVGFLFSVADLTDLRVRVVGLGEAATGLAGFSGSDGFVGEEEELFLLEVTCQ